MADNKGRPNYRKGFANLMGYFAEMAKEKEKHKNKLDEIEAALMATLKEREAIEKAGIEKERMKLRGDLFGNIVDVWKSDASPELKQATTNMNLDLLEKMILGKPVQMGGPVRGPTPEEALMGQTEVRPPQIPDLPYVMGRPITRKMFEPAPEAPKPPKPPSVAERKLKMDAISVASLIRQGQRIMGTQYGGKVQTPLISREDAVGFAGEEGWIAGTPEFDKYIAPAIEEYQTKIGIPAKAEELLKDRKVKKAVWRRLIQLKREGVIRRDAELKQKEDVEEYIRRNTEKVADEWKTW